MTQAQIIPERRVFRVLGQHLAVNIHGPIEVAGLRVQPTQVLVGVQAVRIDLDRALIGLAGLIAQMGLRFGVLLGAVRFRFPPCSRPYAISVPGSGLRFGPSSFFAALAGSVVRGAVGGTGGRRPDPGGGCRRPLALIRADAAGATGECRGVANPNKKRPPTVVFENPSSQG